MAIVLSYQVLGWFAVQKYIPEIVNMSVPTIFLVSGFGRLHF